METLELKDWHAALGATFIDVNGNRLVASYGDLAAEYRALRETAGLLDLSPRTRLCVVGADRTRFLHGQVTNDIQRLQPGEGAYAALVTAKGKIQSDLYVYCLADELLLDAEPGLTRVITQRLEKFVVADDVQVVDVQPLYGLLSLQGPAAGQCIRQALEISVPDPPLACVKVEHSAGELYVVNHSRLEGPGLDLFLPKAAMAPLANKLLEAVQSHGGRPCGWHALEAARIEAGIPRFGTDMDETNFPQEPGIEDRAVSFKKGCYIGQEVLNRIHTMGHVNRRLRRFRLTGPPAPLPSRGTRLVLGGKEVGQLTSVALSPLDSHVIALGYLRREITASEFEVDTGADARAARLDEAR